MPDKLQRLRVGILLWSFNLWKCD